MEYVENKHVNVHWNWPTTVLIVHSILLFIEKTHKSMEKGMKCIYFMTLKGEGEIKNLNGPQAMVWQGLIH